MSTETPFVDDDAPGIEIRSHMPKHAEHVYLGFFDYAATGEGVTRHGQLLYGKGFFGEDEDNERTDEECFKAQLKIGFDAEGWEPDYIPLLRENSREIEGETFKWLEVNPEFKLKFLEMFGGCNWEAFWTNCIQEHAYVDMTFKVHWNHS